jgi:hypothetical protein
MLTLEVAATGWRHAGINSKLNGRTNKFGWLQANGENYTLSARRVNGVPIHQPSRQVKAVFHIRAVAHGTAKFSLFIRA